MWLGRRLADGVGGWLHFEFSCDRSEVFSEKYLSVPIGQILSAAYGKRTHAEVNHPTLAATAKAVGRRPQIDFCVCDPYPTIKVAVESKWVGKSGLRIDSIIWDMIRLEMISHQFNAETYFVLGGRKDHLDTLLNKKQLVGEVGPGRFRSVLRLPNKHSIGLRLAAPIRSRVPMLKKLFRSAGVMDMALPEKIVCRHVAFFPQQAKTAHYQVYAWQISHAKNRVTFLPSNNKHYK